MRTITYTVSGQRVRELGTVLTDRLQPDESHSGNGFAVLMIEKFEFWRTTSNMQVTIILEYDSPDTALVKLTVGGGGAGIFSWTWGSEQKIEQKLTPELEAAFDDLELTATRT